MAATISGFSTVCCSIYRPKSHTHIPSSSSSSSSPSSSCSSILPLRVLRLHQGHGIGNKKQLQRRRREIVWRSVAEDALIPEAEENDSNDNTEPAREEDASTIDQPVSVPVSPSDVLTMFFQAEGAMNETAIPTVTNALQEREGITNLKVKVVEGIATVELTKQTTVQATGVASSLVEIIQGSGFKLQTLNLSFEDEEDII